MNHHRSENLAPASGPHATILVSPMLPDGARFRVDPEAGNSQVGIDNDGTIRLAWGAHHAFAELRFRVDPEAQRSVTIERLEFGLASGDVPTYYQSLCGLQFRKDGDGIDVALSHPGLDKDRRHVLPTLAYSLLLSNGTRIDPKIENEGTGSGPQPS